MSKGRKVREQRLTTKGTKITKVREEIKSPSFPNFVSFVLRKFSGHCSYVAVLNEKIRPHHEVHDGHEGFRIFQTSNFVIFVSFGAPGKAWPI